VPVVRLVPDIAVNEEVWEVLSSDTQEISSNRIHSMRGKLVARGISDVKACTLDLFDGIRREVSGSLKAGQQHLP